MKTNRTLQKNNYRRQHGVALVLTLGLLALITAMFLGYVASMKTQKVTATNYNDTAKARLLAMSAVDRAMAILGSSTPVRSGTSTTLNTWMTAPGWVAVNKDGTVTGRNLYQDSQTGQDTATTGKLSEKTSGGVPTGLNQLIAASSLYNKYDIIPNIGSIYTDAMLDVYWINYGKDGTTTIPAPSGTPPQTTNPLAGRLGFWVDDESSKVNLNYAFTEPTAGLLSTHNLALNALCGTSTCAAISSATVTNNSTATYGAASPPNTDPTPNATALGDPTAPFETLQEWMRTSGIATDIYGYNKFFATVHSYDDNKTFAGALRREIRPYSGTNTSGLQSSTDIAATTGATSLYGLMNDTSVSPWDLLLGSTKITTANTFAAKYGAANCKQIIANIIDYQKSAASDSTYNGLDATSIQTVARNTPNDGGWLGLRREPYINEVLVTANYSQAGTTLTVNIRVEIELINPFNVALPSAASLLTSHINAATVSYTTSTNTYTNAALTFAAAEVKKSVAVASGGVIANNYSASGAYQITHTATHTFAGTFGSGTNPVPDVTITLDNVRLLLSSTDTTTAIRDFGPLAPPFPAVSFTDIPASASWATAQSFERNDPRVRTFAAAVATGSPGLKNGAVTGTGWNAAGATTVTTSGGGSLTICADAMGATTWNPKDIGNPAATPAGDANFIAGAPMTSIGELGRIHTGVPWRTLRLQPRPATDGTTIPDWAILDLVRIQPIESDTTNNIVKGRININQQIRATATGGTVPTPLRQQPLYALFGANVSSAGLFSTAPKKTTAMTDVYNMTLGTQFGSTTAGQIGFDTIGEICEVASLTDANASDADAEKIIRNIANLITVRSNVFTVWGVAQTIQDVNKNGVFDPGIDIITSEQKVKAVIERYESGGAVKFRIKYLRWLTD